MKWSAFKALVKVISEDEAVNWIDRAKLNELEKRIFNLAGMLDVESSAAFDSMPGLSESDKGKSFAEHVHKRIIAKKLRDLMDGL